MVSYGSITITDLTDQRTYIRYSANENGSNFSTTPNTYIGIYTGEKEESDLVASDFKWSKLVGDNGTSVTVVSTKTDYQVSSSSTTAPTGTWLNDPPKTDATNKYLWTRVTITFNTGSPSVLYTVSSTMDSIEVGGKNLYLGTKDFSANKWINISGWTKEEEKYQDFSVMSKTTAWSGLAQYIYDYKVGDYYTISFFAKVESGGTIQIMPRSSLGNVNTNTEVIGGNFEYFVPPTTAKWVTATSDGTEWKRYWGTVKITGDLANGDKNYFLIRIENATENKKLSICGLKLEKGNIATDWTPSPDDVDTKMNQLSTSISGVSDIVNEIEGWIDSKVWETTYVTYTDEYGNVIEKEIVDELSEIRTDISGVSITAQEVKSTLGRNYKNIIRFADFSEDEYIGNTMYWNGSKGGIGSATNLWNIHPTEKYDGTTSVYIKNTNSYAANNGYYALYQNVTQYIKENTDYTLSFWIKSTKDLYANDSNPLFKTTLTNTHPDTSKGYLSDLSKTYDVEKDKWIRKTFTFKTGTFAENESQILSFIAYGGAEIYISRPQLEEGTIATSFAYSEFDAQVSKAQLKVNKDNISMVVSSIENSSTLSLTDNKLEVVAENIDLTGKVTFSSFDSATKEMIESGGITSIGTRNYIRMSKALNYGTYYYLTDYGSQYNYVTDESDNQLTDENNNILVY